mmetsp:Transcript_13672/g.49739  ORF Transcript_13672/g.49739 Transcript_13672/m.49739 type:complete len:621 (+) Transcript_13672:954-2816(+)
MWEVEEYGRVMHAINSRHGGVRLLLERPMPPQQHPGGRAFEEHAAEKAAFKGAGRMGYVTFRRFGPVHECSSSAGGGRSVFAMPPSSRCNNSASASLATARNAAISFEDDMYRVSMVDSSSSSNGSVAHEPSFRHPYSTSSYPPTPESALREPERSAASRHVSPDGDEAAEQDMEDLELPAKEASGEPGDDAGGSESEGPALTEDKLPVPSRTLPRCHEYEDEECSPEEHEELLNRALAKELSVVKGPTERLFDDHREDWSDLGQEMLLGCTSTCLRYTALFEDIPGLIVGSCPVSPADLHLLAKAENIGAMLCLVPTREVTGLSHTELDRAAAEAGIHVGYVPIRDFDPNSLRAQLPRAVATIVRLLRQQRTKPGRENVYCFCTAGIGRSPAIAVAYLHWAMGLSLGEAYERITTVHPSAPNPAAILHATRDVLHSRAALPVLWHEVELVWSDGGRDVKLAGDFARPGTEGSWQNPIQVPRVDDRFVLKVQLPRGRHSFKWIVDGNWVCTPNHPMSMDSHGNWNNWLEVGAGSGVGRWRAEPLYVDSDIKVPLQGWQQERLRALTTLAAFHLHPGTLAPKNFYWRASRSQRETERERDRRRQKQASTSGSNDKGKRSKR